MRDVHAETITVKVPIAFKRQRGRKRIVAPDGTELSTASSPPAGEIDSALVKAIARAYRWQRILESGDHGSIEDLAAAERINPSYLARVLRLTLLAPDIVATVLEGRHERERVTLALLMRPFPALWACQLR